MDNNGSDRFDSIDSLVYFLIVSARGCIDEPSIYGPLRLIEAADRLLDIKKSNSSDFIRIKKKLNEVKGDALTNEEEFEKKLDAIILDLAKLSIT